MSLELRSVSVDIAGRRIVSDADVVTIIERMIKQRRESIAQFEAGKRPDLVAHELLEVPR